MKMLKNALINPIDNKLLYVNTDQWSHSLPLKYSQINTVISCCLQNSQSPKLYRKPAAMK